MAFKAATCPTCGGDLQVPEDRATVNCMYCSATVVVREAIQASAAANINNWLKLARTAATSGNYAEAYNYYTKILEENAEHCEAWFGKGEAVGLLSRPPQVFRLPEMLAAFHNAIEHTVEDERPRMAARAAAAIQPLALRYFQSLRQWIPSLIWDEQAWQTFITQCEYVLKALRQAESYAAPEQEKEVIQAIIYVCDNLSSGWGTISGTTKNPHGVTVRTKRKLPHDFVAELHTDKMRYGALLRQLTPQSQTSTADSFAPMRLWMSQTPHTRKVLTITAAIIGGLFVLGTIGNIVEQSNRARELQPASLQQAAGNQQPAASPSPEMTAAQRLTEVRRALADNYQPHRDPMQTRWGRVTDARTHFNSLPADARGSREARQLEAELTRRERAIEQMARMAARQIVVAQMEQRMLSQGHDFEFTLGGQDKTTLTIRYVLMSRPLVYQLTNESDFLSNMRNAGFRRVIFTDGYNSSWTYDL